MKDQHIPHEQLVVLADGELESGRAAEASRAEGGFPRT